MQDIETKVKRGDPAYPRWRYASCAERRGRRLDAIKVARYLTTGELPSTTQIAREFGVSLRRVMDMAGCRKINQRLVEYSRAPAEALEGRDALIDWYRTATPRND